MDCKEVDEGRRGFLAQTVAAGIVSVAGYAASSKPAIAAPADDPYALEKLEEPIILRSGESLVDRCFVLSQEFHGRGANAVVLVDGDGVTIRNVRIMGADRWDPRWNDLSAAAKSRPGVFGNTVGIRMASVRDVVVERVSLEGLPRSGINGYGITGGLFRDITIRHCYNGINFLYYEPSSNIRIARVQISDTWGPAGDPGRSASRVRPGGWIGGGGLSLNSLRDSTLTDCVAIGEMVGAFKMTNPQRVTVRGFRGCGFQVQGIAAGAAGAKMVPASGVLIEDCVFDKGLGYSEAVEGANGMQITYHVGDTHIRRCLLSAANKGGHGIQVTAESNARIERCTIRGFNKLRGANPAHALDIARGSSANNDFATVNTFVDQQRLVLDRT